MTSHRQLTIWDILDEMSEAPVTSTLAPVWECLDNELESLPVEAQLSTAAAAFSQIADILKSRADLLLEHIRAQNDVEGPVINTSIFAGLVRTTMQLDLDDLIAEPAPQTFRPHGTHQFSQVAESHDSVAAPVEKENVLAMLEIQTVEDVHRLAGDEDVQKWLLAIAHHLTLVKDEITLPLLQQGLKMPMVEVWLGLLLGGFTLEQRGDFYHNENIWIINEKESEFRIQESEYPMSEVILTPDS